MIGPSSNPIIIAGVITVFFVGLGYLSYAFGLVDSHRSSKHSGM